MKAAVEHLLDQGSGIESRTDREWTVLYCGAASGHVVVLRLLLEGGTNIEETDDSDYTYHI
jgi:hypothetical protein